MARSPSRSQNRTRFPTIHFIEIQTPKSALLQFLYASIERQYNLRVCQVSSSARERNQEQTKTEHDKCLGSQLLLSEGRTVVKCISECNQRGRRVVFGSEPVAMSTTFCA